MSNVSSSDPVSGLPDSLADLNVVIIHDPIRTKNGGIDAVSWIARFLEAPIYTLRRIEDPEPLEGVDVREIKPQEPVITRVFSRVGFGRLLEYPRILEYQNWSPPRSADILVTSGTRAQHVIQHADQDRIHFFHTPARWLWDRSHGQWNSANRILEWFLLLYASRLRTIDVTSVERVDRVIANSDLVSERVATYYDATPEVIYPPVDTFGYHHETSDGYFLLMGRIAPAKRVKLVIRAFNDLGVSLKITGEAGQANSEYARECKQLAGKNIEFLGWVTEDEKRDLLARASGLVYAAEREDFGIPPVEAMAAGKPIIGVNEGFTQAQIEEGRNGLLFDAERESLNRAVEACLVSSWNPEEIQAMSRKYDARHARRRWVRTVSELANE